MMFEFINLLRISVLSCSPGWFCRICFISVTLFRLSDSLVVNSAINKTVTMSREDWPGSLAVDGNLSRNRTSCQCCAGGPKQDNPWLRVDLGRKHRVVGVVIYGRTDLEDNTVQDYSGMKIFLHDNLTTLKQAVDTIPDNVTSRFHNVSLVTPVIARYVTVQLGFEKRLVLCEIQVFTDSTNVAQNKSVTISSRFPSTNFDPSHAVDGNLLGAQHSGTCDCCAATGSMFNPWIRVDLGGVFRIFTLLIYGRTGYGETFDNMNIYLHLLEGDWGNATRTYPTSGTFINETFDPDILARYLTLQQMGNLLTLYCEIEVYGECQSGTFGSDCRACHCDGSPCDIWDGVCPSGICLPGYRGESCDTECPSGTFGSDCRTCHCDGSPCDIWDGVCPSGICLPGYTGESCDRECASNTYGQNCSIVCGNCLTTCNHVSGSCDTCTDGYTYTDIMCSTECANRSFGANCSFQCGRCLNNEQCNVTTGHCENGCSRGYKEGLCITSCDFGKYGYNCNETCGHCYGKQACDRETGSCGGMCAAGYKGDTCHDKCLDGRYGDRCQGVCHCMNNMACNHLTGQCPNNSCRREWRGRSCNISTNVALNKTVAISLKFPSASFDPSHAVDGKLLGTQQSGTCGCCAATYTMWNPWIQVDLGGVFRIFTLVVYGRTGTLENFNNMNIYLHLLEGDWGNASRTYPISGVYINETFDPDIQARYVTLQQMGNLLTVYCEVEVYGECLAGMFGSVCRTCHCDGSPCDVWDGVCPSGKCLPGYKGASCDTECSNHTYGRNCSRKCGACLDNEICDTVNGSCSMCKSGYKGDLCDTECSDRTFGINCSKQCGKCYDDEQCNVFTGECMGLCSPGYRGRFCNLKCSDGTFGINCSKQCGMCSDDEQCNVFTGECMGQCAPGYRGRFCNLTCLEGTYGQNCSNTCGHCFNNTLCNVVNGVCDECDPGYKGQLCRTACQPGTFGIKCQNTCGHCSSKNSCYTTSGICDQGCAAGYKGIMCNEECQDGTFGLNCSQNCPACLEEQPCNKVSGKCSECPLGRHGDDCSKECPPKTFGPDCRICHCDGSACNIVDGVCPSGKCLPGYRGVSCDQECTNGTYGPGCFKQCGFCSEKTPCNTFTGICENGCKQGFIGAYCNKSKNIAYKANVTMSSVLSWTTWGPSNAVDGIIPTDINDIECQCCAVTRRELSPWLRIDFGNIYQIFNIIIYWKSGQGQGISDVKIYFHNSTESYDQVFTTVKTDEKVFNETFKRPVQARYLTLLYCGFTTLAVCELHANTGECRHGTYGHLCEHDCHCAGESCDSKTGYCPSRLCLSGYTGHRCDQALIFNTKNGVIIGSILGPLFLLIIIVIIVAILYRKYCRTATRSQDQQTYEGFSMDSRINDTKSDYAILHVPSSS